MSNDRTGMEAYFPVVTKCKTKGKARSSNLFSQETVRNSRKPCESSNIQKSSLSSSQITKGLLNTLSDPLNPLTHSDIYERTDHVVSFGTGHQVSNARRPQQMGRAVERGKKPRAQQEDVKSTASSGILSGTRIYIDGYLEHTTDIEMKRLVLEAGGQIMSSASQCTHILTSRGLSGSKTHKFLTKKPRSHIHVVKPDWVLDSIMLGKRRSERSYAMVKHANTLQSFLEA